MKNQSPDRYVLFAVVALGIGLALFQYIYNRSFWEDEAALSLNILQRSPLQLLQPLDHIQVAPPLFLLGVKGIVSLLGAGAYTLRLLPLAGFMVACSCLYLIARKLFRHTTTIIFVISAFALGAPMLYYASEVKQYITDVMTLCLLVWLYLRQYRQPLHKFGVLALAGATAIFFSHISPVILATLGVLLLADTLESKKHFRELILVFACWAASFGIYYFTQVHGHPSRAAMLNYWTLKGTFMPLNPFSPAFWHFLADRGYMMFMKLINFGRFSALIFLLWLTGVVLLAYGRRYRMLLLLTLPVLLHLGLSALRLFPFQLRLILYLAPLLILMAAYGFELAYPVLMRTYRLHRFRWIHALIPLPFLIMLLRVGYPIDERQVHAGIRQLQQRWQQGDQLYLYHGARKTFHLYQAIDPNLGHITPIFAHNQGDDHEGYIRQMQQLRGRVWVLYAHFYRQEADYIHQRMSEEKNKLLHRFQTPGMELQLFLVE